MGTAAELVLGSAGERAKQSDRLKQEVESFLATVRAASAADLAEVQQQIAQMGEAREINSSHLVSLQTIPQVLGFFFRETVQDGADEDVAVDHVELLVRSVALTPDEVRRSEAVLRRLGFASVAARLREIAGRRRHELRPLT